MILHHRLLLRELSESRMQILIFVACVILSLTTIVALNGFKRNVNLSVLGDAKSLHGADIIIHSHYDISAPLMAEIAKLEEEGKVESVRKYEFYSVVRGGRAGASVLANIKITSSGYPFYGQVRLESGDQFSKVLTPGKVVVERLVLEKLGLQLGDYLRVGKGRLLIADVVSHEPDRPVKIFSFGPRVLVSYEDMASLELISKGSRIEYNVLLKLTNEIEMATLESRLKSKAIPHQERINTYRNARSGMKIFFDNLLFFLSLISIFTLILAGLGIQSSLNAFFRQKEKSIAMMRAMGARTVFLYRHYLILVVGVGMFGSMVGVGAGLLLERYLPQLFEGFIPVQNSANLSLVHIVQGLGLGLLVILFFSFLPLYELRNVRPVAVFRKDNRMGRRGRGYYLLMLLGVLGLTGLVVSQLEDRNIGLYFMAGLLALIGLIALLARVCLGGIARIPFSSLTIRQGFRSLTRPGNATGSIILTLASAISVLFTIYLVETNLQSNFIQSYPADAPNLYCLDIQPEQRQPFLAELGRDVQLFPIIRARVAEINGEPIDRQQELKKKRDSFAREFNLTHRGQLLDDEVLVAGESLFPARGAYESTVVPVSILDTVATMGDLELGDLMEFNIQGVFIQAKVSSIRSRTESKLFPFFYFVFPDDVLANAPATYFAAIRVDQEELVELEGRVGEKFPNISFINVTATAKKLGGLLDDISAIVAFFATFSILAGGLILTSSILSTRYARMREAVYYKILGGNTFFVSKVFVHEHIFLGAISALIAVVVAQAGSWMLCHFLFEINFGPQGLATILLVLFIVFLVVLAGGLGSLKIVREKPSHFLREQPQD